MKKIAVILCVLLSLFVFVSCPTPDNAPEGTDERSIELFINIDIFPESMRSSITKLSLAYEGMEPVFSNVDEEGNADFGTLTVKEKNELHYSVKAYDESDYMLAHRAGKLMMTEGTLSFTVNKSNYVPQGIVKILNGDLHFVGGESYLLTGFPANDGFGKEPGKDPGKKPDEEAYYGNNVPVSDGEYTVLDGAFEFLQEHGSLQLEIINEVAWLQGTGVPRVVRMTPYFNVTLKYDENRTEYIIDNGNAVKDRALQEETHEIKVAPQGEFLDELKYLYFYDDPDYAHADRNKAQIEKRPYDDFFRYEGKFYGGRPYEYYVMGLDANRAPITEMATIRFILPEVYEKANELKPELVSCAKVTINNPSPGEIFLFSITCLNDDGTVNEAKSSINSGVDFTEDSIAIYLPAGKYGFVCSDSETSEEELKPRGEFEVKPYEVWSINAEFGAIPEITFTKSE